MNPLNVDKTYLVTGGAGFIGFHLSKSLLERGARVIGFDNLNNYYDIKLSSHACHYWSSMMAAFGSGKLADWIILCSTRETYRAQSATDCMESSLGCKIAGNKNGMVVLVFDFGRSG